LKDVEFLAVDGVPIDDELQDTGTVGPDLAHLARSYRNSPRALVWRNPSSDWRLFVLLLPLAATSTQAMMRRLGRRWGELHRLVYAVAILGVLHFAWHKAGKNLLAEPMIYAAVVGALLAWRVWWHWRAAGRAKVFVGQPRSSA